MIDLSVEQRGPQTVRHGPIRRIGSFSQTDLLLDVMGALGALNLRETGQCAAPLRLSSQSTPACLAIDTYGMIHRRLV